MYYVLQVKQHEEQEQKMLLFLGRKLANYVWLGLAWLYAAATAAPRNKRPAPGRPGREPRVTWPHVGVGRSVCGGESETPTREIGTDS